MREYILILLVAAARVPSRRRRAAAWRCGPGRWRRFGPGRPREARALFRGLAMLCGVTVAFLLATNLPFLGRHSPVRATPSRSCSPVP
jgi:hypothetical protein